jgi:hypothetical protein
MDWGYVLILIFLSICVWLMPHVLFSFEKCYFCDAAIKNLDTAA